MTEVKRTAIGITEARGRVVGAWIIGCDVGADAVKRDLPTLHRAMESGRKKVTIGWLRRRTYRFKELPEVEPGIIQIMESASHEPIAPM